MMHFWLGEGMTVGRSVKEWPKSERPRLPAGGRHWSFGDRLPTVW